MSEAGQGRRELEWRLLDFPAVENSARARRILQVGMSTGGSGDAGSSRELRDEAEPTQQATPLAHSSNEVVAESKE